MMLLVAVNSSSATVKRFSVLVKMRSICALSRRADGERRWRRRHVPRWAKLISARRWNSHRRLIRALVSMGPLTLHRNVDILRVVHPREVPRVWRERDPFLTDSFRFITRSSAGRIASFTFWYRLHRTRIVILPVNDSRRKTRLRNSNTSAISALQSLPSS